MMYLNGMSLDVIKGSCGKLRNIFFATFALLSIAATNAQVGDESSLHDDEFLTNDEKKWISDHPVIRATNYTRWAPLDYYDGEKPKGFSVDYLNLVASKIGVEIDYVSSDSIIDIHEQLRNKKIDIAHGLVVNAQREEYLNFTTPYLNIPLYYFGRIGAEPIESLDDLEGRRIGVINGIASATAIKENYSHLMLIEQDSVVEAFQSLSEGKIDVFTVILPIANYTISRNGITGVEVIGQSVFPELKQGNPIRLAVRKDWPVFADILEKGKAAVTDAEFRDLSSKWQAEYQNETDIGLTNEEKAWLASNRVIRVTADPDIAPLEFIDQFGEINGISGSYLKEIGKKLNVRFEWIGNDNFNDGMKSFQAGNADILSAVVLTDSRREVMNFTDSYISLNNVIFARDDAPLFGTMDGLYDYKVAQIRGFSLTEFIRRDYPDIKIVEVDSIAEALTLVTTGEVDASVGDILTGSYYIAEAGYTQLVVAGEAPYTTDLAMGVSLELPLLASAMGKAMRAIPASNKAEIFKNWQSLNIDVKQSYDVIWQILGASAAVIIVILIWILSLRREVTRRKIIEDELIVTEGAALAANRAKSNFLGNMSHEIRTPLNAIIGFSEVMSSGVFGKIKEEKYRDYIKDIKYSGEHLATVVNDILDLSKIDTRQWQIFEKDFDILVCAKETVKMLGSQSQNKGVTLLLDDKFLDAEIAVYGDEHAIKRALINLMSNAVKFTNRGGKVTCFLSNEDDGALRIVISDTGIGIPPEKIQHVLIPFGQGHEGQRHKEAGTGLGLPIVKHLVELHGGHFILESEVGIGTKATIWLPQSRVRLRTKSG